MTTVKIAIGLNRCCQVLVAGQCPCVATHRYTWPGRDEAFVCKEHADMVRTVAAAMGLTLQLIELDLPELELPDENRTIGGR